MRVCVCERERERERVRVSEIARVLEFVFSYGKVAIKIDKEKIIPQKRFNTFWLKGIIGNGKGK